MKSSKKAPNSRAIAAKLLSRLLKHNGSLATLLNKDENIPADQASEIKEFCYGVMRWYFQLDGILNQLLDKPLRSKDEDVRALLLIGLYQLQYMRVPSHAAVSETVNAASSLRKLWAKGLINAVLRSFERDSEALISKLSNAQQQAFPDWLAAKLKAHWPQQLDDIITASNQRPPMTLRINSAVVERAAFAQQLTDQNIAAQAGKLSEHALTLAQAVDVHSLPGFADGAVSVQDEAAQLAAGLLQVTSGDRVLDACCAPGGKTCHLLEQTPDIELDALDNDAERLLRVSENLQRLKLTARLITGDASAPQQWADAKYQRILLDVPCSATGVIRRNPDLKYLRRENDIAELCDTQMAILRACWDLLLPGGKLLYVTCSILPEENEQIVAAFVESQPDATHDPITADWGVERAFGRQLLPSLHDGFYYARLQKQGE